MILSRIASFCIYIYLCFLLFSKLAYGFAQLVRTGCKTISAPNALQAGQHFSSWHPLHQTANALQVAIATTPEMNITNAPVYHFHLYVVATRPYRFVEYLHLSE